MGLERPRGSNPRSPGSDPSSHEGREVLGSHRPSSTRSKVAEECSKHHIDDLITKADQLDRSTSGDCGMATESFYVFDTIAFWQIRHDLRRIMRLVILLAPQLARETHP